MRPDPPCLALERVLATQGLVHFAEGGTRLMLEVYPHPATVVLFDRETIFRYKKGPMSVRRSGLQTYREAIAGLTEEAPSIVPTLAFRKLIGEPLEPLNGTELKAYEDRLDALFCAYLAAYAWCWRDERIELIGNQETGCIMVPTHTLRGTRWSGAP